MPDPKKSGYLWDNSSTTEVSQRFEGLEAFYDPATFRYIEELGIGEGWGCLEVGGGGGSVARWLSKKVGRLGHVLVTDINPSFLAGLEGDLGNVKVLRPDITDASDLPSRTFDLAHARLVLIHIPEREKALSNMVSTLKPGGWVMVEDFDIYASQALDTISIPPKASLRRWPPTSLGRSCRLEIGCLWSTAPT